MFSIDPTLSGGSQKTMEFAQKYNKPRLHLHAGVTDAVDKLKDFVQENSANVLNVAGPRASKETGVGEFVMRTLEEALTDIER